MKVQDVYTRGAVHIPQSRNPQEAAVQMRDQHVGALVVTDGMVDDRLIGIVTDRDIVLKATALGASPLDTLVAEVMTAGAITIDEDAELSDAMQAMFSHGVRRLAVTDGAAGVVGILSLDDVIDALGRDWALLTRILRSEQQRERSGSVQSPLHL
ncbi:hypoxic response protein 1 [mine drainage metagenome]|uniref:Hypoxic response protein 1 n=1 Tax=mine drainage metagenome TaxID=410659 RepID=A0A1J5QGS8_9ZZZZ